MKKVLLALLFFTTLTVTQARELIDPVSNDSKQISRVGNNDITFEFPQFIFTHTNTSFTVKFKDPDHPKLAMNNSRLHFIVNGNDQLVTFDKKGEGTLTAVFKGNNKLSVLFEDVSYNTEMSVISIWYMILPLGALLLFIMYKIAFGKKNVTLSKVEITERIIDTTVRKPNLKVVRNVEEEALV
ncbi:MAG: hypothetical protein ACXVC6_02410 [Bacteroidia bacterium]